MKRALEEILEAIWRADEQGNAGLAAIREICPDDIAEDDIGVLIKRGLITKKNEEIALTETGREEATGVVRRHRLAGCRVTLRL